MGLSFPIIILTGRPAAGKSEVIDYLKSVPVIKRAEKMHIGPFEEIDDFPFLWEKFEEDDMLEKAGKERLHSDSKYYFKDDWFWNFMIKKVNLAIAKKLAKEPDYWENGNTLIIEWARGGENGMYEALENHSDQVLANAAIVYIKVSYEESVRKNRRRARPGEEDSILFHSLPDEKMDFYYKENDWEKLAGDALSGYIEVRGHRVPFSVLPNEPEVTLDTEKLGPALMDTFERLWKVWNEK